MTEASIFDAELEIIKETKSIIEENQDSDHPLFNDYQKLSNHYEKLFHQFERMMKISDRQQQQLINTKDYILNYNKELKQLNATRDKFFSIIAHDLKSPINSFLNTSNTLVNHIDRFTKAELVDMATDVKQSGENLFKLLENLLYWARIQMKTIEFIPEIFALDAVVYHNISLLQLFADQKEIKIISDISDDIEVFADINMLNTVLRNLISNAIKFTHKCGLITISHSESEKYNKISIEDNGVGISPEDQDKLFRIDVNNSQLGTENEQGTGLGLVLCKEMVDKHQGTIEVDSRPGTGTIFSFSLMKRIK